ncbi:MAG: DUF4135 domain-containing protein [Kineosporiaceae bacterium]
MSLHTPTRPPAVDALGPTVAVVPSLLDGVPDGDGRLRAVLALAAPAPDRRAAVAGRGPFTAAVGATRDAATDAATDAALEAWLRRAGATTPAQERLLVGAATRLGRDPRGGLTGVSLPASIAAGDLPDWARAVVAFLAAQPLAPTAGTVQESFAAAAWRCCRATPRGGWVGSPSPTRAPPTCGPPRGRRLAETCRLSLRWEAETVHGVADPDTWAAAHLPLGRAAWLERFERLPGLAHAVGLTCARWQRAYAELLRRLAADRDLLVARLWGRDPGALDGVRGDAGDRHAGGRCVSLLRFETGLGAVYKPKDQQHADGWARLVAFLNREAAHGDPDGHALLHERVLISRVEPGRDDPHAAYGWEELLQADPLDDPAQAVTFYERLGGLIRLVQLLEGRDLWADNLLACGDSPAVTDLECLLYPRVQVPPSLPAGQAGLLDALEASVVRTAMPAQPWVPSRGARPVDIGCLSPAGDARRPDGSPLLPLPPYRPVLAATGAAVDAREHVGDVVAGYRRMHDLLAAVREDLAADGGPLAGLRGVPTRYIWRHTWDGYRILDAGLSPRALTDGVTRETVLAGVVAGALPAVGADGERRDILDVVLHEVEAFRDLDVPMFTAVTTEDVLADSEGRLIIGHLQGTAWERLVQRVGELEGFDLEAHVDVLTASLDAARDGQPLARTTSNRTTTAPPTEDRIAARALDAAIALGDDLLAACVRERGSVGWLTQSWYPGSGMRQVEVAGPDLLTGSAGVAVLLAELGAVTGLPRFADAAAEALERGLAVVAGATTFTAGPRYAADARLAGGGAVPGGLFGPGALLYALARAGDRLGERALVDAAASLVPQVRAVLDGAVGPVSAEPALGTAGALATLVRLRAAAGEAAPAGLDELLPALVAGVAGELRGLLAPGAAAGLQPGSARRATCPQGDLTRLGELAPTGAASAAAALATAVRAGIATGAEEEVGAVLDAWTADPSRRGDRIAGAAVALARAAAPALAPGAGERDLPAAISEALTVADAHEVAGDADGAARCRASAVPLAQRLLGDHDEHGVWFPDRVIRPRLHLSSLDGTTAAGLALLRLADASVAPLDLLW